MENRKRERIIEAGMALLLVITLLAAGQSGKIPVVKSQEIQVQADSGKENESKEKGNTENTDSESGSDMESVAVAASAAQYPIMGKSDVSVQEMVDYFNRSGRTYPAAALAAGGADSIETFCQIYYEEATAEGVRPEVAYVQAMKEFRRDRNNRKWSAGKFICGCADRNTGTGSASESICNNGTIE